MNIVGLSAFYHESACCLLRDGVLVAAAAEERFSRRKHDPRLPVEAFRYCLQAGGIDLSDVDVVAYYEEPIPKLARQLWAGAPAAAAGDLAWIDPQQPARAIRERLGFDGPLLTFPHHLSHAASAFFFSGFDEAAVLTADGVGEWATTTYGHAAGSEIDLFEEVRFPHSLGLLYATLTAYLGFRVNGGEYKVMGLAPYGESRFVDAVCNLIGMGPDGQFKLNMKHFDFLRGRHMYAPSLAALFGGPPRRPGEAITQRHKDIARSLQLVVEEILLEKVRYLAQRTGARNLCMAGGVALNCVAVGRIQRLGCFERLFVQPAAGDAGACLGAAALAHVARCGEAPARAPLTHVAYGPRFDPATIGGLLAATGLDAENFSQREDALAEAVASRLAAGKVVGWFHGAMEFGPRALGQRSILADPRDAAMRQRVNGKVKKREAFRPFAPSVLAADGPRCFELDHPSPFMLETCQVRDPQQLPAVTHVDGSARPQTVDPAVSPRFAALLAAFQQRTGCPALLNTSFNVRGEPIVCTPVDALFCFGHADLDCLVLEDFVIDREALPEHWATLLPLWERRPRSAFARGRSALREQLYSFV